MVGALCGGDYMYKSCASSKALRVLRLDALGVGADVVDEVGAGVVFSGIVGEDGAFFGAAARFAAACEPGGGHFGGALAVGEALGEVIAEGHVVRR